MDLEVEVAHRANVRLDLARVCVPRFFEAAGFPSFDEVLAEGSRRRFAARGMLRCVIAAGASWLGIHFQIPGIEEFWAFCFICVSDIRPCWKVVMPIGFRARCVAL